MEVKVTVERANNGYIVLSENNNDEEICMRDRDVFEDKGDSQEIESFVSMIWFLAEYFGVIGSKHDEKRFWVGMIPKDMEIK